MTEAHRPTTPTTVQLAVPVTDAGVLARLTLALQYAPQALAEVLSVELPGLLDQVGAYHVTCPSCGAAHVECTLGDAPDDTWGCPTCGKVSSAFAWLATRPKATT